MNQKLLNYFNQDELAATVWEGKYAAEGEQTPDDMHWRMAKEFARVRYQKDASKTESDYREKFFKLFANFEWIVPQGSVMSMLGSNKIGSLSNCFVVGQPEDSYGGILLKDEELVQLMKRRGGVGLDISSLRPNGVKVSNAAKSSTGSVSFMERFSNSTREVAQGGRRGALMLTLDVRHPDIMEFCTIKSDPTKITGANISVKLRNDFMESVKMNGDYILRFPLDMNIEDFDTNNVDYDKLVPYGGGYIKKVKSKEIWDTIINSAHAMAEPGIMFLDNHWNYSPDGVYEQYKGITTNPCGEIFMQKYDACRLILLNLFSFVKHSFTPSAKLDYELLEAIAYEMQMLADDLVDLEIEHIDRILAKIDADNEDELVKSREKNLWNNIKKVASSGRRTGCGITGMGDAIAAMGVKYDSEESFDIVEKIMYHKFRGELKATIDMAKKYGSFNGYEFEKEFNEVSGVTVSGKNEFFQFVLDTYPDLVPEIKKFGRRNVSFSTVAPAGSVSICTQTTSGIEPLFMPFYIRRKKINPNEEGVRVDFVDQNGDNWQEFPIFHYKFFEWWKKQNADNTLEDFKNKSKDEIQKIFEESPWFLSTANDIDWEKRVEIQAIVQKYTTHSISSTINLPNNVSVEKCKSIYMSSWKHKLKGVTIYRDGCRTGVLVSNTEEKKEFKYNNAPKRPKQTKCNVHRLTALGEKWVVLVGLIEDKPYELFAIPQEGFTISNTCETGFIVKKTRGKYNFICNDETVEDISSLMRNEDERSDTRMYSLLLRHGVEPTYIIQQIEKSAGNITSFNKSIARTLKKYVDLSELAKQLKCTECGSNNLAMEEGCMKCLDCGNSKCG